MKFKVITLFPEYIECLNNYSIIGRAIRNKKIVLETVNLRDFGLGSYKQVDDRPYSGSVGMLMRVDVATSAIRSTKAKNKRSRVVLLAADGKKFTQKLAEEYSTMDELVLLCAHYEGHDKRIEDYVDEKISVGDYVVSGGETPAMLIIDAVARLIKGVLGKDESSEVESHSLQGDQRIIEHPQYTRPFEFEGKKVPKILLSGDPKKISVWTKKKTRKSKLI